MKRYFIIFIIIVLSFLMLSSLKENWQRNRLLKEEVASLQKKELNLQKEHERLEKLIQQKENEDSLEKEVRLMLGFKKEGEKVVLVIPPTTSTEQLATTTTPPLKDTSRFSKVKQIWYSLKQLLTNLSF